MNPRRDRQDPGTGKPPVLASDTASGLAEGASSGTMFGSSIYRQWQNSIMKHMNKEPESEWLLPLMTFLALDPSDFPFVERLSRQRERTREEERGEEEKEKEKEINPDPPVV